MTSAKQQIIRVLIFLSTKVSLHDQIVLHNSEDDRNNTMYTLQGTDLRYLDCNNFFKCLWMQVYIFIQRYAWLILKQIIHAYRNGTYT